MASDPKAQTHADDEFTLAQLVAHSRDLFGWPGWAVEAALVDAGQTGPQTVKSAQKAIDAFMQRVAA